MRSTAKWMISFGLMLIGAEILAAWMTWRAGAPLEGRVLRHVWLAGIATILAGLATAQGRRSLRLSGYYLGLFLPLILAGMFVWQASEHWRGVSEGRLPVGPAILLSLMAALSVILIGIIVRLRPREGIASRGYAVALPNPRRTPAEPAHADVEQTPRSGTG